MGIRWLTGLLVLGRAQVAHNQAITCPAGQRVANNLFVNTGAITCGCVDDTANCFNTARGNSVSDAAGELRDTCTDSSCALASPSAFNSDSQLSELGCGESWMDTFLHFNTWNNNGHPWVSIGCGQTIDIAYNPTRAHANGVLEAFQGGSQGHLMASFKFLTSAPGQYTFDTCATSGMDTQLHVVGGGDAAEMLDENVCANGLGERAVLDVSGTDANRVYTVQVRRNVNAVQNGNAGQIKLTASCPAAARVGGSCMYQSAAMTTGSDIGRTCTAAACQARCQRSPSCQAFTWEPTDGQCQHGSTATVANPAGAFVSGPQTCAAPPTFAPTAQPPTALPTPAPTFGPTDTFQCESVLCSAICLSPCGWNGNNLLLQTPQPACVLGGTTTQQERRARLGDCDCDGPQCRTIAPTDSPASSEPTAAPTVPPPTRSPTPFPTRAPTATAPTRNPTRAPVGAPTTSPTETLSLVVRLIFNGPAATLTSNPDDMAVMRVAIRNLIQDRSFQACRCDGDDLIRHTQITDIELYEYQGNPDRTAAVVYFNGSTVVNSEVNAVFEQLQQDATQRFELACCSPNGEYVLRQVQVESYSYSTISTDLASAGASNDEEGMSAGAIFGIVILVLLLVGLGVFLVAVFAFGWKRDEVDDKWVQLKTWVAGKREKKASSSPSIASNPNFTMTETSRRDQILPPIPGQNGASSNTGSGEVLPKGRATTVNDVGKRVVVDGYSVKGKLQFAGRLRGTSDRSEWYGVKFDSAVGDCDGSRAGIAYFTCDYNCGILVSVKSNVVFMARRSKPGEKSIGAARSAYDEGADTAPPAVAPANGGRLSTPKDVGKRVVVDGFDCKGVLKHAGPLRGNGAGTGDYFGIKLDQPLGASNGSLHGERYFDCDPDHGVFVLISEQKVYMAKRGNTVSGRSSAPQDSMFGQQFASADDGYEAARIAKARERVASMGSYHQMDPSKPAREPSTDFAGFADGSARLPPDPSIDELGGFDAEAVYENTDISARADALPPRPSNPGRGQALLLGTGPVDVAEHGSELLVAAPVAELGVMDAVYGNMNHGFDDSGSGDDMTPDYENDDAVC